MVRTPYYLGFSIRGKGEFGTGLGGEHIEEEKVKNSLQPGVASFPSKKNLTNDVNPDVNLFNRHAIDTQRNQDE